MMNWLLNLFSRNFGGRRHRNWGKVRKRHLTVYPNCSVCGKKKFLISNIPHHIKPFHLFPEKELDMDNLITLCRTHHFLFGHLNYWRSYNPKVVEDCKNWAIKIFQRP